MDKEGILVSLMCQVYEEEDCAVIEDEDYVDVNEEDGGQGWFYDEDT